MIKTDSEIKILKEAAQIADAAFEHILSFIRPGVSEIEVSNELEFFMRKQGATSSSFDIIVASGLRSALPHGVASEKVIEKGDFVTLDFGAYYKGYCSDITRTIAVGEPSDKLKEIYNVVLEAQIRGVNGIKAGLTGREADALTRDYITEKGYGEYFGHSTGHGVGLEIHEAPGLAFRSETVLEPGMAVTVEPGIYIPGVGGVRIEDDIIITSEGNEGSRSLRKNLLFCNTQEDFCMISVNDFRTGLTISVDNGLWQVLDFQHVKPGKGAAFVRSKLRNLRTGSVQEKHSVQVKK